MLPLFWDASAVSKRYTKEHGSHTVNALFAHPSVSAMVFTVIGYGETYAILRRRFNGGLMDRRDYPQAQSLLELEVVESLRFRLLPTDAHVMAGLRLIDRHNLNSTDAAILAAYLDYRASLAPISPPCVLVASDHRLLRAAQAEGLPTLDPESLDAADVPSFLKAL